MKLTIDDLPICIPILTGHTLNSVDGSVIEKGDFMQIIAPKSQFHKWIVKFFSLIDDNSVRFLYRDEDNVFKDFTLTPRYDCLTWEDFKFKKINSLEDVEK